MVSQREIAPLQTEVERLKKALLRARTVAKKTLCDPSGPCPQPELCGGCRVASVVDAALSGKGVSRG